VETVSLFRRKLFRRWRFNDARFKNAGFHYISGKRHLGINRRLQSILKNAGRVSSEPVPPARSNIFYLNGGGKVDFKRERREEKPERCTSTWRLADVQDP